jgi:hypothetical protein
MTNRNNLLRELANGAEFKLTNKAEALKNSVCICCGEPANPRIYSAAGLREYQISGLCEECFDEITAEE